VPEASDYVISVTTAMTRRADNYVEKLDDARQRNALRDEETAILDQFESYTIDLLDRYPPPGLRRRDSLAFTQLYTAWRNAPAEEGSHALIAALLAAEVESRGPLRLTQTQNARLARIFEGIGDACLARGLPRHAALAFDRAATIHLLLSQNAERDRCLLAKARAINRSLRPGWRKALGATSGVLCGYGYQPYRLLLWMVIQLVAFSAGMAVIQHGSIPLSVYMCLTNFLNPLGVGDTASLPGLARVLLVAESYAGSVSLSVFFALLVRRWFQS
jgi:hypothetical protein